MANSNNIVRAMEERMTLETISDDLLPAPFNAVVPRADHAEALFWRPQYVRNDTVLWHVPFLFWLIEIARPNQYVEIGVGEGVTYMAACQSLHRLNYDGQCHAVGVWKAAGDRMDVPNRFAARNAELYEHFSRILTDGLENSHRHFATGSVDLMLVDFVSIAQAGTPAADIIGALREKWLPKLSERGILLLHGVGADEGANALVEELSGQMPALRLSGGQGIITLLHGGKVAQRLSRLAALPEEHQVRKALVKLFNRLGAASYYETSGHASENRAQSANHHLKELREEYDGIVVRLEESLSQYEGRHRQVANLQARVFDLEMARDAQKAEVERLEGSLKAAHERLVSERASKEAAHEQLSEAHERVRLDAEKLLGLSEQRQEEIARLSGALSSTQQECYDLARQLEAGKETQAQLREEHHVALEVARVQLVDATARHDLEIGECRQANASLEAALREAMDRSDRLEAAAREEFTLHLQGIKMLTLALEQNENVAQALATELRYVEGQIAMAQENEAVIMELALQNRRVSPLQRLTSWTGAASQGDER